MLSETISYLSLLGLTIVFTSFALVIQDKLWRVMLKMIAGLFWMVMAVANFNFFGSGGFLMIMSLPYVVFGLVFWYMILHDFLAEKKERIWQFDD